MAKLPDSRRYISRSGVTEGPFTVDEIYDLFAANEIPDHTLFWSEAKNAWKPIVGLMLDVDPDKLDDFKAEGVRQVRVLGSKGKDCQPCSQLIGKVFPIESPPVLPPKGCYCRPWCGLVLSPVREEK